MLSCAAHPRPERITSCRRSGSTRFHRDYAHPHIVRNQQPARYASRQQLPHPTRLPPPQPATHPPHPHETVPPTESPQLKRTVSSYVWPDNKLPTDETSLFVRLHRPVGAPLCHQEDDREERHRGRALSHVDRDDRARAAARVWPADRGRARPRLPRGRHDIATSSLRALHGSSISLEACAAGWALAGLIQTSAFMWSGATFSPTAMTCPLTPFDAPSAQRDHRIHVLRRRCIDCCALGAGHMQGARNGGGRAVARPRLHLHRHLVRRCLQQRGRRPLAVAAQGVHGAPPQGRGGLLARPSSRFSGRWWSMAF